MKAQQEQWWKATALLLAVGLTVGGAGWLALFDNSPATPVSGSSMISLERPRPPSWNITTTRAS
ncbi:MAG: hypothetical protein KC800_30660 [Candidatus Eremiobacteraeota bacterium]|nr:hypothetical protein [Candidatus Eremiobacteraeota bacterium]